MNPTKSICDQYVFNTIITRAQSLVVCVGNPFLLFSTEKSTLSMSKSTPSIYCWREYVKRCLETSSLQLIPQCYRAGETVVQEQICRLYSEVFEDLKKSLDSPCTEVHEVITDSILNAYKRAFQASKACQNMKVMLGNLGDGDRGYVLQRNDFITVEIAPKDALLDDTPIECYLESTTFSTCTAIPLNLKEKPITIQGINNRRCALEGAHVKVCVYKNSDRCGRVCEVVDQGPQRQFVCHVDDCNAVFFLPIDHKTPRLVNLPGLSCEMLMQASNDLIIKEELKYNQHAVTVFDPKSFCIPSTPDEKMDIPQIKDVIPLSIAQKLLFVVCYLRWTPTYRYPLGVVIAAIPKGLTLYHGERLLLAHHHINTAPVDEVPYNNNISTVPTTLPHYDYAFTIGPPGAEAFDDALTLEPVASDDGKCYQLGVHITNVGGAVRKGSEVDACAQKKGTTMYGSKLSSRFFPILSKEVRDALSLDCGKNTLVISFTCQVRIDGNHDGVVPNTIKICESCVQSRAQLTYEEVQHSLAGVKDMSLDGKVTSYNKTLSTNKTFGLEHRLALLLQISESFFRNRVKSDDMDYSTEGLDQIHSPQAYFLVEELMVWANRIAAKHTLTAFPQLALLHRQKPPNQDQLVKVLEKYEESVPLSPIHKTLADHMGITAEPGSVIVMELFKKQLYEALQSDRLMQTKNLLRITNYHPQLAVLYEEVNSTKCQAEYVCYSVLQEQKSLSPDNNSSMVSLPQDGNEVYSHNDLCCLYTHSTSPLKRYIDIVVQRLILQSLCSPTSSTGLGYTVEELNYICRNCNTQTWKIKNFEREFDCFNVALSLAQCSQPCTVYIASIEKSLNFVIRELGYESLSKEQRSFHFSSITSNATAIAAIEPKIPEGEFNKQESCKTYVWKTKVTSFNSELAVNEYLVDSIKCQPGDKLTYDAILTFCSAEATSEGRIESGPTKIKPPVSSGEKALVQHCYITKYPAKSVSLGREDWKKATDFMKCQSQDTAAPLKVLLGGHECSTGNDVFPPNASFVLYEAKQTFKVYESFKASFTATYSDHILSPCIQLLEIAPMLNVCVQHSTKPADCFSSPILSHASKVEYNDIKEYIELWESVLVAETAVQSVDKAEIQLIQNVPLKWPMLKQPGSSLDDVHYSPFKQGTAEEELADITLTLPDKFGEHCGEYVDLHVGNLVCARYNIPLCEEKEVDGRKVTTASAVYHFVIHQIEDPNDRETQTMATAKKKSRKQNAYKSKSVKQESNKIVHMKFASKDTARVSPFMRQYLKDSTCEIQVIPVDLPYR